MQNLNDKPSQEDLDQAIAYVDLCVAMCRAQAKAGRFYMFEHPAYASSWKLESLNSLRYEESSWECAAHVSI